MAGRAHNHYPGAGYHVMLRGNGAQDIFLDESDLLRFYGPLGREPCGLSQAANRLCKLTKTNPRPEAEVERIGEGLTLIQICQA